MNRQTVKTVLIILILATIAYMMVDAWDSKVQVVGETAVPAVRAAAEKTADSIQSYETTPRAAPEYEDTAVARAKVRALVGLGETTERRGRNR